jgi:hypothetical protein
MAYSCAGGENLRLRDAFSDVLVSEAASGAAPQRIAEADVAPKAVEQADEDHELAMEATDNVGRAGWTVAALNQSAIAPSSGMPRSPSSAKLCQAHTCASPNPSPLLCTPLYSVLLCQRVQL